MSQRNDTALISSNTRSKLHAFRYTEDQDELGVSSNSVPGVAPEPAEAEKENQILMANIEANPTLQPELHPSIQNVGPKPNKECPQTPANRIPLEDLIGNTEDAFKLAPVKEATPDDRVVWQYITQSSEPRSRTPATQGKKRCRSSSPNSSPLKDNRPDRVDSVREPFDMQRFHSLLVTPHTDLATDLWNNYIGKSVIKNKGDAPPSQSVNFVSSPHTPASSVKGRDSSALKRSTSCNAEWPTSRAKRRRIEGHGEMGNTRGLFSRSKSNIIDSGKTRNSRISFLIDKLQGRFARASGVIIPAPQSSSPLRNRAEVQQNRAPTPSKRKGEWSAALEDCQPTMVGRGESYNDIGPIQGRATRESSSEFGDEDLDLDLLELVDCPSIPFAPESQYQKEVALPTHGSEVTLDSTLPPSPIEEIKIKRLLATKTTIGNEADEYEYDGDDDEFNEDIEEILAGCGSNAGSEKEDFSKAFQQEPNLNAGIIQPVNSGETSSGDEFDDDFDLVAIENSMLKTGEGGLSQQDKLQRAIKRYLIVNVAESTYATQKGRTQPEQVLLVEDEKTRQRKVIVLRESWFDSPCMTQSYIHLIGDFDTHGQCVVDSSRNMIILHPDHLISATVIADATSCQRRAVLQDRIKLASSLSKPQVFGQILHEVFQEAMKANQWNPSSLKPVIETILARHVESLYAVRVSMSDALEYVISKTPALKCWATIFLRMKPNPASVVEDRHGSKAFLSINKLLGVEEHIWSPMYGLKGNVDATVQVAYNDGVEDKVLTVPLEVKTGNRDTNHSHRAQTALYTLLISDRYDIGVNFGLLYYLETARTFRIQGIRHEIIQMIQERNRLAGYVRGRLKLPAMIKRPHMCGPCYLKSPCFIYHKLVDDGDGETSGMGDQFSAAVGHLNVIHRDFFRKWDDLLTKEEKDIMKFRRELWTMLSSERESLGRCFGKVIIEPGSAYEDMDGQKINRYRYTFVKQKPAANFSFVESQITLSEPIIISDENGHFALANGYVLQISSRRITVAVDRNLHGARVKSPGFNAERNQTFKGIMEIGGGNRTEPISTPVESEEPMLYRLDKDEFSNGMATVRNNLIYMMEKDLFQAHRLRRLIIEGQAPSFGPISTGLAGLAQASLNVDQKRAIEKVMSAEDFALVLGMPGTGKTTTIAYIIRALVAQGKSVLLASYTHTAVDNILLKIRNDKIPILRIGAISKVHPEVQQFADLAATPKKTIEELRESYEHSRVVATTCLGVNHPIFNERVFDYCIVDEASQVTLPVCLGPIRMARTFILVGDHYQLPPLVQNREALEGGLDISLFKLLSDSQPSSVVNLEHQYRMCEEIMLLSNTLVYSNRLKCGTPEVASRCLEIPNINNLKEHHSNPLLTQSSPQRTMCFGPSQGRCWLTDLLDPAAKTRLVNTDPLHPRALESANGSRIVNSAEVRLCAHLIEAFVSAGIPLRGIGVITFYRSQLSLLKQNLHHYLPELEMHTADKFQGRDKEVVILSCVRSNSDKNVGDLLKDWRRVNVAFTRARTKLLVLGSKSTLHHGTELLNRYVTLMETHGWIYDLPKSAIDDHIFQGESSGLSQPRQTAPPSPKTSPAKRRAPLRPVHNHQPTIKQPEKRARLLNGNKIVNKRPIMRDIFNDIVK